MERSPKRISKRPVRQELFDELVRTQRDKASAIAEGLSASLATVVGRELEDPNPLKEGRGKIRVLFDDEDEDRTIGLPRAKGVSFMKDDRIVVLRNKSGDYIAGFPITSSNGLQAEEAVGPNQIKSLSIQGGIAGQLDLFTVDSSNLTDYVRKQISDALTKDAFNTWKEENFNGIPAKIAELQRDVRNITVFLAQKSGYDQNKDY